MDFQKNKLRNRLNLKFQPHQNLPSHRYSLKKISLDRKYLDRSENEQESQSTLMGHSRSKSISMVKLPSLQKLSTSIAVKEISPIKKLQASQVLSLIAAKQKLKSPSIKLSKIEQTEHLINTSVASSAISNLSKFNYGIESIPTRRLDKQMADESILFKRKQTNPIISSRKFLNDSSQNPVKKSILFQNSSQKQKFLHSPDRIFVQPKKQLKTPQPSVKVQSKSSIHQTLSYLIRNQILTIPKIVALLQKSHSEEFLYMKVRGIYEFEVCDENDKGKNFVTVSRNGMVIDGQMVPLEKMVHQFNFYNRLRKIPFFKHFIWSKFMVIWSKGSKKAQFIQNRNQIYRNLNLDNKKLLKWNLELKRCLTLTEQTAGSLKQTWIQDIDTLIRNKRQMVMFKLIKISYEMLSPFELPISESIELMNKALHDLNSLNNNFEIKIRIEKQLDVFYRMTRCLEFQFPYFVGQFVLRHIDTLSQKIRKSSIQYNNKILKPMESLDVQNDTYSTLKEQILINSHLSNEIPFTMSIDSATQSFVIQPNSQQIYLSILSSLQNFYQLLEKQSFKLVRTDQFTFVMNSVNKNQPKYVRTTLDDKPATIKHYIISLAQYQPLIQRLEDQIVEMNKIFRRREELNQPFLQLYKKLKIRNGYPYFQQCEFTFFEKDLKQLQEDKELCSKIHDGEYFIFGYLDQTLIKTSILQEIKDYEEKILTFIPEMNKNEKAKLRDDINKDLASISAQITSPQIFIEVVQETERIEQRLPQYSSKILELQKIGKIYLKSRKRELEPASVQKNLLAQLRSKIKNFKERKETLYFQYRRLVETQKKSLIQRIQRLSLREQQFYNISQQPKTVHKKIKEIISFLTKINSEIKHFNQLQIFYNIKETNIPKLDVLLVEYESLQQIWKIYTEWQTHFANCSAQNLFDINANRKVVTFDSYMRKLQKFIKNIEYFELCKYLLENVSEFLESMQFIVEIQFKSLRESDFREMNRALEKEINKHPLANDTQIIKQASVSSNTLWQTFNPYQASQQKQGCQIDVKQLSLQEIIAKKLYRYKNLLEEITFKCRKQLQIKDTIENFTAWWKNIKLTYRTLDQYPLIYIFDSNDNIRREIDEYTTILISILNHKYASFVRKQCSYHIKNINNLTELLRLTIEHQEKFLTLYPILTSEYAEKHLSPQFKKFETILEKTMKNLRWLIRPTQSLNEQTKTLLTNHIKHFDTILKYLSDFLEKKRIKFQRFYFLQDNQMLQLLVGHQNQNHVFRMFEGIRGWLEDDQQIKIGIVGVGGEHLKLKGWVYKNHEPENMFRVLQEAIKLNLNSIVRKIMHSYESQLKELKNLYKNIPWMCVYTVQLILYTKQIELNCFYDQISFEMQKSLIRQNILIASSSPRDNSNYITLMIFLLHFTEQLQKQNVSSVFHFEWYSFLKYYHENNMVVMRCLGDQHSWGGEYQGLWSLMVNTSDIQRVNACVLTNLKYGNGVLLQGPSGTGKTQSLKELGRCMAKYCVIFNCSNEVSIQTMQKLLSGLCYTASWICLDQINRMTAEVMSVIANQINTIKNALISGKSAFNFMGKKIQLKKGVGIFSTMNPIYLQRATLTENLKSYFRVISVNTPNYETILEVMLYSLSYLHASDYASKISRFLKNLSIQLGNHLQYDFGMRTIKVFLKNLSKNKKQTHKHQEVICNALCETFYSRLNPSDTNTFDKVLKDIFGFSLDNHSIKNKVLSIRQSVQTGTIIVGPTSCKTTLISKFIESLSQQKVESQIYNATCLQPKYLMGENVLGRWNPGVLEKIVKKSLENENNMYVLILDNKLKSEIIQNFNTLLDQSRLLTLANGTRLKIHDNFKLLMETSDLAMTSPATITRCHVVYVNLEDVQKNKVIESIVPNIGYAFFERISSILSLLSIGEILRVGKLYPLVSNINILTKIDNMGRMVVDNIEMLNLSQNQMKGLEKSICYAIHLLDLTQKIKPVLKKQYAISSKRHPQNFFLSFQKYQEGEFVEIYPYEGLEKKYFSDFIPTVASQFCQKLTQATIAKGLSIFWRGKNMVGRTTAIKRAIERVIRLDFEGQKKVVKITIDKIMSSKRITSIIDDRMSIKNNSISDDVIIYVENVSMCSQDSEELLRYLSQFRTLFTQKNKGLVKMDKLSTVAEYSNTKGNLNSRLTRHFADLPFPELNQNEVADFFSKIIKLKVAQTKTTSLFKENLSFQIDKISVFLTDYIKKKNKAFNLNLEERKETKPQQEESFTHLSIISCLNNLKAISQKFVRDSADFMEFLLCELRKHEMELSFNSYERKIMILDTLKLAFNDSYKQKFEGSYTHSLKSITGQPKQVSFYSGVLTGFTQKVNWNRFKAKIYQQLSGKFYLSEFMVVEMIYIMRTLEYQGGNYILVGKEGLGKKSIFKMAAEICECLYKSFDNVDEDKISERYFGLLKESFLKNKKSILVIDANSTHYKSWLLFLERLKSGYLLQFLFKNQDIDQAYSLMEHFEGDYQRSNKSYEEIVKDFFRISNQKIHIFISSRVQNIAYILENCHYLSKQSAIRLVQDFPSDSITEISLQILQDKIFQQENSQRLTSVFLKLYNDLNAIVQENFKVKGYSYFKHNPICHFKLIQSYVQIEKKILDRLKKKEDKLNKAIFKVEQTDKILLKLKIQTQNIQKEIAKRQQKIGQFTPILAIKRSQYQHLKEEINLQKKEIEVKQRQAEEVQNKINEKHRQMQPFAKEAGDSILSIKRSDLNDSKSISLMHPLLKFTFENLMMLLGEQESEESIRKTLSDIHIMARLKNCNCEIQVCMRLRDRIVQRGDWNFDSLSKAAFHLRYLYKWMMNTIKTNELRHSINQKNRVLQKMKKELSQIEQKVSQKYSQLVLIQGELNQFQQKYFLNKNQLASLQQKLSINTSKIQTAEKAKKSLDVYMLDWKQSITIGKQYKRHLQYISTKYTYFLNIHPFLQAEDKKSVLAKLQTNLKKAMFTAEPKFDPFLFLQQELTFSEENIEQSQQSKQIDSRQKTFCSTQTFKNLTNEESTNQNIVFLLQNFNQKPIIFDPDNQALKWLHQKTQKNSLQEGRNKIIITRSTFTSAKKSVQLAIKEGYLLVLLVEDEFDEFTTQILSSKVTNSMNRRLIEYNKNLLYIDPNFKIILCNKSRRPNPSVSYFINHQVINFEVTQDFLKAELLNQLLMTESQDLYQLKLGLEIQRKQNSEELKKIQNIIIQSLINHKKSLFDDQKFIITLQKGDQRFQALHNNFKQLNQKISVIINQRNLFQNLCHQACKIYDSLKIMSRMSQFFSWNVQIFIKYFLDACRYSISKPLFNQEDNDEDFTFGKKWQQVDQNYEFNNYIGHGNSRATSALSYVSAVTSKVMVEDRKQDFEEQNMHEKKSIKKQRTRFDQLFQTEAIYIEEDKKGHMNQERQSQIIQKLLQLLKVSFNQNQRMSWALILSLIQSNQSQIKLLFTQSKLREDIRDYIQGQEITKNMKSTFTQLESNAKVFANQVIIHPIPFTKYSQEFSELQILILCKLIKPDRFHQLAMQLIKIKGFNEILDYKKVSVNDWLAVSDCAHPILLMMGQDPLPRLSQFFGQKRYKNVTLLAMGQGQSKIAQIVLQKECKKQNIVIIHNLHISPELYQFLSKTLQQFEIRKPHNNFRLILITNLNSSFDVSIASSCHKFLVSQPKGIKNQMKYLYEHLPVQLTKTEHKKLGYSICFFHSMINQLQKYNNVGWNVPYEFNTSDFINAIKILKQIIQSRSSLKKYQCNIDKQQLQDPQGQQIDFLGLRYLIGEVNYVGKLVNEFDRQKMRIFVRNFIDSSVIQPGYKFFKKYCLPVNFNRQGILNSINQIDQNNTKLYGLHEGLKPSSDSIYSILTELKKCYSFETKHKIIKSSQKLSLLPQINHAFYFINSEIQVINQNLIELQMSSNQTKNQLATYDLLKVYQLLSQIKSQTKVFDLRSFPNPGQFFIQIQKQAALRLETEFQKIEIVWALIPKQNVPSYGIQKLKLQGGVLIKKQANFYIDIGREQKDIILYVYGSLRKKKIDHLSSRKLVRIPLYMNEERQGQINSYGDNTNLITMLSIESAEEQETWTLRNTAFIADCKKVN